MTFIKIVCRYGMNKIQSLLQGLKKVSPPLLYQNMFSVQPLPHFSDPPPVLNLANGCSLGMGI